MNNQLYEKLGIEENQDLESLLSTLEEKQFEYLERHETASSSDRKKEIEDILGQLDKEIASVKDQIKSTRSSLILDEDAKDKKSEEASDKENQTDKTSSGGESKGNDYTAAYGATLVQSNESGDIKKGFKYLQTLSENGDLDAMKDYLNACLKGKGGKKEIDKAISYCEKLKLATDDSFNKKKLDNFKQSLKEQKQNIGKKRSDPSPYGNSHSTYSRARRSFRFPWWLIIIFVIALIIFGVYKGLTKKDNSVTDRKAVEQNTGGMVKITVQNGNIRAGSGTNYNIVGEAHLNQEYVYTGNSSVGSNGRNWYEIYMDSDKKSTGWVSEKIAEIE